MQAVGSKRGVESVHGLTRTGNKRRVRRIQLELPLFRQQVAALELQLKRLQLQKTSPSRRRLQITGDAPGRQKGVGATSVWNGIAGRQLKERLRAEKQQQQLLETRSELAKLATELCKLLQKARENEQELSTGLQTEELRFYELSTATDDEFFSQQLTKMAKLYLKLQQRQMNPSRTMYFDSGLMMGQEVVKQNSSITGGIFLEATYGTLLPFTLDVVTEAYWKFTRFGPGDNNCIHQDVESSANTFSRSFLLKTSFQGSTTSVRGKYTCKKYEENGSVTLVWSGTWDVFNFGGVTFRGMQLHKRGFMKLKRVVHQGAGQPSTSTMVESHFETIPIFHESADNKAQQVEDLVSAFSRSYTALNDVFRQTVSEMLLEADWKASFGSGIF